MLPVELAKRAVSIVLGGAVLLGVAAGGVSWYQLEPAERSRLAGGAGLFFGWIVAVLLVPWATFFLSTAAGRARTNWSGVLLVAGYTITETVGGWLAFGRPELTQRVVLVGTVGLLFSAVYNLLACDWIADKWG